MVRTGAQYIAGLNDGRQVMLDGEIVSDVATHPAFSGVVRSVARLYDHVADPANLETVTYPSPTTGAPVNLSYLIPRSENDLRRRRVALREIAEQTFGLVGRGPEHVAGFLAGWAGRSDVFAAAGDEFAARVRAFYEHVRDSDLYCVYAIVPPQIDRSKPAHQQEDPFLYAGVKEERPDGIVISGSQMLATGGAIADYLVLSSIVPLSEGDEDYAITVAVPLGAPGLRLLSRRSYAAAASSTFDYPLTTQFDETDALAVFDDVLVPWEHVFVFRDRATAAAQWNATPAHLLGNNQAQIRFATKLDFLTGLAHRVVSMNRSLTSPAVTSTLGELAACTSLAHAVIYAQEQNCEIDECGIAWPARAEAFAMMTIQSDLYPKMLQMVRDLAGGGLIQLPSSVADFFSEKTRPDIDRFVQSPGVSSVERVKLLKLVWDLIGSEFGSRHLQYEMFYAGAPHAARNRMYHVFDFDRTDALVDRALNSYSLTGDAPTSPVPSPASPGGEG